MKRVLAIAVVGLAAALFYSVSAPAGSQAVTPKQFAALSKKVKKLQAQLKTVQNCALVQAVPVVRYGGGGEGYVYRRLGGAEDLVRALDIADVARNADGWMLITTSRCATIINSG